LEKELLVEGVFPGGHVGNLLSFARHDLEDWLVPVFVPDEEPLPALAAFGAKDGGVRVSFGPIRAQEEV
jgi:hypothetical protein